MKKNKQQIIDELNAELKKEREKSKDAENYLYLIKKELWGCNSYQYKFDDILTEIREIEAKTLTKNIIESEKNRILEIQNIKYWTLIRSLVGDKTLENDLKMQKIQIEGRSGQINPLNY